MKPWHYIVIVIALSGAGFAVYWFFIRSTPKISKVAKTGTANGYTVDIATGLVSLNGTVVGIDNGDDSWTSTGGSINDFNGEFIKNSALTSDKLTSLFNGVNNNSLSQAQIAAYIQEGLGG